MTTMLTQSKLDLHNKAVSSVSAHDQQTEKAVAESTTSKAIRPALNRSNTYAVDNEDVKEDSGARDDDEGEGGGTIVQENRTYSVTDTDVINNFVRSSGGGGGVGGGGFASSIPVAGGVRLTTAGINRILPDNSEQNNSRINNRSQQLFSRSGQQQQARNNTFGLYNRR